MFSFVRISYIIPVTGVNQDHLHSVIQFTMDRIELVNTFACTQCNEIPRNTIQNRAI